MGFNMKNFNKTAFRTQITRKQNQFKRFVRRFKASRNPVEKRFLKTEGTAICNELKVFAKQWKNFGFGTSVWVTRNCTTAAFSKTVRSSRRTGRTSPTRRNARKSHARRSYARKGYGKKRYGRKNTRRSHVRSSVRKNNRRFKVKSRRYYTAW